MNTIIIPVGPTYQFFKETLQSINNQLKNYELIVGVDGFTDSLEEVHRLVKNMCPRFKLYYSESNIGPSIMRNTLCGFTHDMNVIFMDADDTIQPEFFMNLNNNFPKFNEACRLALCNQRYRNTGIYDLNVFRSVGGYNPFLMVGEDNDLFRRFTKAGYNIGKEPKSIVNYRIHETNISKTTPDILKSMSRIYRKQTILDSEKHNVVIPYTYDENVHLIDSR